MNNNIVESLVWFGVPLSWARSLARVASPDVGADVVIAALREHGWPLGGVGSDRRQAMYAMDAASIGLGDR